MLPALCFRAVTVGQKWECLGRARRNNRLEFFVRKDNEEGTRRKKGRKGEKQELGNMCEVFVIELLSVVSEISQGLYEH